MSPKPVKARKEFGFVADANGAPLVGMWLELEATVDLRVFGLVAGVGAGLDAAILEPVEALAIRDLRRLLRVGVLA